jgi:hypothetical protein
MTKNLNPEARRYAATHTELEIRNELKRQWDSPVQTRSGVNAV